MPLLIPDAKKPNLSKIIILILFFLPINNIFNYFYLNLLRL